MNAFPCDNLEEGIVPFSCCWDKMPVVVVSHSLNDIPPANRKRGKKGDRERKIEEV